jgi:hypothetical protein
MPAKFVQNSQNRTADFWQKRTVLSNTADAFLYALI